MKKDSAEKFWSRINLANIAGCWNWTGATKAGGYGRLLAMKDGIQRLVLAHRFSWEAHNGSIPDGLSVLHKCDNPPCVNPAHLFIGTRADNIADKTAKGRAARGEAIPNSKMTEETVRAMRAEYSGKRGECQALANKYGITHQNASAILSGKRWRHV